MIETMFYSEVITISGHFFLVPENAALETILLSLGLQIE